MPTPRFIRALAAQETSERPALLITFTHANFPAPVRLTDCGFDLVTTAASLLVGMETEASYTAWAMQPPVLPGEGPDPAQRRAQLVIDNTDRSIMATFAMADSEITARLDLVLADAPDDLQETFSGLRVLDYEPGQGALTITLAPREDSDEVFPYQAFTPKRTPGLFT
jgi:hypothetical protein